jgi:hypothetical protein
MLFLGCLAIVFVLALPSIARAAAPPVTAVGPASVDQFIWVKGAIELSPASQKMIKFWNPVCSGIIIEGRKAGGELVASTHATPGSTPGECVYALKVPAGQALSIGVQDMSFKADAKDPSVKLLKIDPVVNTKTFDKTGPSGAYFKYWTGWAKLVPAVNGEFTIKGEQKLLKLAPGQGATVPLFIDFSSKGGAAYY